jgi:hypothetical protein
LCFCKKDEVLNAALDRLATFASRAGAAASV